MSELTPAEVILQAAGHIRTAGHCRHFLQPVPSHVRGLTRSAQHSPAAAESEPPESQRPMCVYGAVQYIIRTRPCRADWWKAGAALDAEAMRLGSVDKHRHQHAGVFNDDAKHSVADILAFMETTAERLSADLIPGVSERDNARPLETATTRLAGPGPGRGKGTYLRGRGG